LRLSKNLHLLHVCKCNSLPILILIVLQKNVHQKPENSKIELNIKKKHIVIVIDSQNGSIISMYERMIYEVFYFYKTLQVNMLSVWSLVSVNKYNLLIYYV